MKASMIHLLYDQLSYHLVEKDEKRKDQVCFRYQRMRLIMMRRRRRLFMKLLEMKILQRSLPHHLG